MAKFDIGKTLKKTISDAGTATKKAAEAVADTAKEIKIPDIDKEKVKNVFKKKEKPAEETVQPVVNHRISAWNAMKVFYYLMAADGAIHPDEMEKFDSMGKEFVPDFLNVKEKLIQECQAALDNVIDAEDYYDVLQDCVENALLAPGKKEDAYISPKFLIWDLLTIAYSDDSYDETERRLLKYIVRKLNIDKAVFLELESSLVTLMDLEKELAWIKTTDRPYLTIEAMVNEIADRRNVIFESVKDLITL